MNVDVELLAPLVLFLLSQVAYNIRKISSLESRISKIEAKLEDIEMLLRGR